MGICRPFEEMKAYVESFNGYELLDKIFEKGRTYLVIKCPLGHIFKMKYDHFKGSQSRKPQRCPECAKLIISEKLSIPIEDVIIDLKLHGFKIIEGIETYINSSSEIKVECEHGHITTTKYHLLKRSYKCRACSKKEKPTINFIKEEFIKRDLVLLATEYINNKTKMPFICNNHPEEDVQYVDWYHFYHRNQGCSKCGYDRVKLSQLGSNNSMWKGGTSSLLEFFKNNIEQWKKDSLKNCNYLCVLSGGRFKDIHHLYSLNKIIDETLNELDFDLINSDIYFDISQCTEEEQNSLREKCLEIHYRYPLGICIKRPFHILYHRLYGYGNNTPKQFKEFVTRLRLGDFNNFLEENNLQLNINYKVLNDLLI